MSIDAATIEESNDRDRRAVYVGTTVTAAATLGLFVLPDLVPVDAFRGWYFDLTGTVVHGNPFRSVRFWGGLIGGAVAGRLTSDLGSGAVIGVKAAVYGLGAAYLLAVAYYIGYSVVVARAIPPLIVVVTVPLVYGIPLIGAHVIGGTAAGWVTARLG